MDKRKIYIMLLGIGVALFGVVTVLYFTLRDHVDIPVVEYVYEEPESPEEVVEAYRTEVEKLQAEYMMSSMGDEGLVNFVKTGLEGMHTPAQNTKVHMEVYLSVLNTEKQGEELRNFLGAQIEYLLSSIE